MLNRHLTALPTLIDPEDCHPELAGMVASMQREEARDIWCRLGVMANKEPALFIELARDLEATAAKVRLVGA